VKKFTLSMHIFFIETNNWEYINTSLICLKGALASYTPLEVFEKSEVGTCSNTSFKNLWFLRVTWFSI